MDYNVTFRKKDKSIQTIISYKDDHGFWKQKSKQGFKTQKEAKPWIDDTVDKLKDDLSFNYNTELNGITFEELFDKYIEHATLYKEKNTIKNYYSAQNYFEKIINKDIKNINTLDLQECVDDMVKAKLNPDSISNYTAKIKIIFKYAIKPLKVIKDDPFDGVTLPKTDKVKTQKVKALTKVELNDLLSKITYHKHYMLSLVAATCGLRIGEILGLTWDNIDEKKSTMTIDKQWKIKEIKPAKFGFGDLKSKNSYRTVPIPPKTMAALVKFKKDYPIHFTNRIFPYARTDSHGSVILNLYKSLGYDISVHDLRHTYASTLVANGLDFKTVAELMGHTVEETIKTYSHFTSDMMTRATKVVNSIF